MKLMLSHVLIGLCLLVSCQKAEKEKEKTLHLNILENPLSLDPRCARTIRDLSLTKQLFEGLTRLDKEGSPKPALAEKIDISADALTYTFHLRESYWTTGEKVTASDFLYAWKKVLSPSFATDYSHMLFAIKNAKQARMGQCSFEDVGVKALDEKTLVVELEYPTPYFLELVAFPTTFPILSGLDEKVALWNVSAKTFVGNGPFKLQNWNTGAEIILEKNETYWDKEHVFLDAIAFTILSDASTESYLFEKGQLDWLGQPLSQPIFNELLTKLRGEGKVSSYPVAGTFMVKFNVEKSPFSDARLRKAFSYAISREQIIKHVLQGKQQIATGILPPVISLQKTPYFQDGDKEEAKKLFNEYLTEKKLSSKEFPEVVLSFNATERNSKIAQLLQEVWQQTFTIKVKLNGTENQFFRKNLKSGDYIAGLGDWIADFQDPISFLELFQYRLEDKKSNGMNDTRWHNEQYSRLLDMAVKEKELPLRNEYYHQAEKILIEEMPVAPIYHYSFDYTKKDNVKDVFLSPLGIADYKYAICETTR